MLLGAAAAFIAVFAAWLIWAGIGGTDSQLDAKDTGYEVVDDRTVTVRWDFTIPPGTPATCAVEALNSSFGIVGWKVIEVPASDRITRSLTETVLTTELAVTGLIYRCWLA
jgi:hypothetical protein